jgi:hypothetical protein
MDDDEDGGYVTVRDAQGTWQVVEDATPIRTKQSKWMTPKFKAKKHMDPVVAKVYAFGDAFYCQLDRYKFRLLFISNCAIA